MDGFPKLQNHHRNPRIVDDGGKAEDDTQVMVIDTIKQRGYRSKYGRDGMDANHIKSSSQVPPNLDALKGAEI